MTGFSLSTGFLGQVKNLSYDPTLPLLALKTHNTSTRDTDHNFNRSCEIPI